MPLDAKTPKIDKSKLPSRHVSVGPASAPDPRSWCTASQPAPGSAP